MPHRGKSTIRALVSPAGGHTGLYMPWQFRKSIICGLGESRFSLQKIQGQSSDSPVSLHRLDHGTGFVLCVEINR